MIIVDLDNNIVSIPEDYPLPNVPQSAITFLKNSLKKAIFPQLRQLGKIDNSNEDKSPHELEEMEIQNQKQIRLCFLAFYVYLFRDIRKYLNVELGDTEDVFDIDNFLNVKILADQQTNTEEGSSTTNNPFDTEYSTFWDTLLKTKMFEIFTQKLANKSESRSSMGLFIELSSQANHCSATEVFDIVLTHSTHKKDPSHVITMNNPKSFDPVTRIWNPNYFPPLDEKLCCSQENSNSNALLEVKHAIRKNKHSSSQLYFLHAHLQMQKYHYFKKDIKYLHNAFSSCVISISMDPNSVPDCYISCLLEFFSSEELEKLESSCVVDYIAKEIHEIVENRRYSVHFYENEPESSDESDQFELVPSYKPNTDTTDIIDSLKAALQSPLDFGPQSLIPASLVIKKLQHADIIPDDPVTLSK